MLMLATNRLNFGIFMTFLAFNFIVLPILPKGDYGPNLVALALSVLVLLIACCDHKARHILYDGVH